MESSNQLKQAILGAVYGNPELKSKVQEAIEEDMGDEMPIEEQPVTDDEQAQENDEGNSLNAFYDAVMYTFLLAGLSLILIYAFFTEPDLALSTGYAAFFLVALMAVVKIAVVTVSATFRCFRSLCCGSSEDAARIEMQETLLDGNDTGICHNCDVKSMSVCGSCGCCMNCCVCANEGETGTVMIMV